MGYIIIAQSLGYGAWKRKSSYGGGGGGNDNEPENNWGCLSAIIILAAFAIALLLAY